MPHVVFTSHLQKHLASPAQDAAGATVRDVLNDVFAANPRLRGYILDDQDRLRQHVVVFVDNRPISDRNTLSDPVKPDSEVYVMQALSGG